MNAATQAVGLNTPIADDKAIRAGNFFNGRLLTSKDLGREQDNRRQADAWLGQAVGVGIAWGLEASPQGAAAARTVQVKAGLAVNRAGQTLRLAAHQVVTLVAQPDAALPGASTGFGPCGALSGSTTYAAGNGLYLLTLAPLMVDEGTAPVLALDPGSVRCNTDAKVEAVQLRLLYIDDALLPARGLDTNVVAPAAASRLRNAAAYACFGFPAVADAHLHPGAVPADNLLDALAKRDLSPCDVPLALIHLTASGIVFVDRWSVRRRIAADCAAPAWSALIGEDMDALGEAQLVQFQEQLAEVSDAAIGALTAVTSFAWLPPAGFLDATGARQLNWSTFLGPHQPVREVPLAAGDVRAVLAAALRRDSVPVSAPTRYRVYSITGSAQSMFVREAPNSPHAEEVWLDGTRAALDGASNVQQAIEMLRARSCRQLVLWPGADLHALVAKLKGDNTDLSLCFEAGDYKLSQPLVLEGLGHVTIHGAGAGSRLRIDSGECALRVNECKSVTVTNLSLHADRMTSGKDETGIDVRGALTVFSTPSVRIEGVRASCSGSGRIAGAGIVVSNAAGASAKVGVPSSVQITSCELSIGRAQVGIQCINTDLAVIRQNLISCSGKSQESLQRGIVVAGVTASEVRIEDNVVSEATEGISVDLSKSEAAKGDAPLADRVIVARNSVMLRVTDGKKGNRHGIFIGNANSVLVQANRVVTEDRQVSEVEVNGVTLTGVYGRQVIVRDNHFEGPRIGIVFTPGENKNIKLPILPLEQPDRVWLFAFNVAESATEALQCPRELLKKGGVVDEHNIAP